MPAVSASLTLARAETALTRSGPAIRDRACLLTLVVGVTLAVGGLTYLPALILGPIGELLG